MFAFHTLFPNALVTIPDIIPPILYSPIVMIFRFQVEAAKLEFRPSFSGKSIAPMLVPYSYAITRAEEKTFFSPGLLDYSTGESREKAREAPNYA
ncbi:MAG: hypothetical protein H7Y03_10085 [Chitinophagaceae bacterium]|nr:hypothetical protein [Chitinophagaceae bacterium]